ncbi:MAG: hypothetical protein LRY50_15225, partial [Geovibrio sp.]|nr:hypothetical protein [Geovibrio sp.]
MAVSTWEGLKSAELHAEPPDTHSPARSRFIISESPLRPLNVMFDVPETLGEPSPVLCGSQSPFAV